MSNPMIYHFGGGSADGDGSLRNLLGGKGANLAEMTKIGIPVPPGFTITTEVCNLYRNAKGELPEGLEQGIQDALARLEENLGARFGEPTNPLLLSVRSGARASMPGMMDTILNVGLNDTTVEGLAARTGDARFAWDSYRRFIQMFGDVVLGVHHFYFEEELHQVKEEAGVREDHELNAEQLKQLVGRYKAAIAERSSKPFPEEPRDQLAEAIHAVFDSWDNSRAVSYRAMHGFSDDWGTAVNVQAMVFGNMGDDCATGVAFTRDPSTGEPVFYGEFLANAQGEDVVAGIRTPQPIAGIGGELPSLEETMPAAYNELFELQEKLEAHYGDMQDIEFTIQQGRVWILQTRTGKRTAAAAVRIAVDMANEGVISRPQALLRVSPTQVDSLLHPTLDRSGKVDVLAKGLPASPGAATGTLAFSAEDAEKRANQGESVILVRNETSPEDIRGMAVAAGILTARGGMTSHAAVVARQMGRCCVAGCKALEIDARAQTLRIGAHSFGPGDTLTLDGSRGEVIRGSVPLRMAELSESYNELMSWADDARTIGVRTNADNGKDAALARRFGAEGIGLTRTEHMFFEGERINAVREMILSTTPQQRANALEKLRPMQTSDFLDIFKAMKGLAVTVRLLDPPLHEFLPEPGSDLAPLATELGVSVADLKRSVHSLAESNPMLGHRGVRLAITYPEIYDMQVRAIFDAMVEAAKADITLQVEIMVPLVSTAGELKAVRERIETIRSEEYADHQGIVESAAIGTMIELPRACVTADQIAEYADFISFGTNDLTQTTLGFSRDDSSSFLPSYVGQGLMPHDPFQSLDIDGVGTLIDMACQKGRSAKASLKIGICGEHGADPDSVEWLQDGRVDYVSCSPFRVPIARLAAAQAAVRQGN